MPLFYYFLPNIVPLSLTNNAGDTRNSCANCILLWDRLADGAEAFSTASDERGPLTI